MNSILRKIRKIWNSSPAELVEIGSRRVRRMFGRGDHGWDYSLQAVLRNPKHMNFKMEIERWERMWRMCRLHQLKEVESHFDFVGKTVLEAGCGPVLGIGPLAIFRGAQRFFYQEPDFVREVIESSAIRDAYFQPLHQELVANYGQLMPFEEWYSKVLAQSAPLPQGLDSIVDITVSHSVLEHIPRKVFADFLLGLYLSSRPGAWFAHTVDFGPHGFGKGRMESLYEMDRQVEPPYLNLLRKSDVEAALRSAGFRLEATIPYKTERLSQARIHESWREYSEDDLSHRVVIFLGSRPL